MASRKRRSSKAKRVPISAHRSFVPLIAGWAAALGGLTVAVLPAEMIARIATLTQLSSLGGLARIAIAVIAALVLGAIGLVIAKRIRGEREPAPDAIVERANLRVRPIVPAEELGSDSFDSPLVEKPNKPEGETEEAPKRGRRRALVASDIRPEAPVWEEEQTPSEPETETEAETEAGAGDEQAPEAEVQPVDNQEVAEDPTIAPEPSTEAEVEQPLEVEEAAETEVLELAESDICEPQADVLELAESDVCEPEPEPDVLELAESDICEAEPEAAQPAEDQSAEESVAPIRPAAAPDITRGAAIESLRDIPKEELSLMQMVERFAVALHEHQEVHGDQAQPRRDAALAEALRALTSLSEASRAETAENAPENRADATERELREALAKLQTLSGAA